MDNGLLGVSPFCFNLVDELQSTMTMFAVQAHTQGIELQLELGDGVDDDTCIVADPTRLCQILVNLMCVLLPRANFVNAQHPYLISARTRAGYLNPGTARGASLLLLL